MEIIFNKLLQGYRRFRQKYATGDHSVMQSLAYQGQSPEVMIVACCDSRVDPALILQCDPGDLFIARNVANIIPPYEKDSTCHGTSAALEFGICFLKVKHLIILGHSQCGGIKALMQQDLCKDSDFINTWVSHVKIDPLSDQAFDPCVKQAMAQSYENALGFPWIREAVEKKALRLHRWFFKIETGEIWHYAGEKQAYLPLGKPSS